MKFDRTAPVWPAIWGLTLALLIAPGWYNVARAASLTQKDVQILVRAMVFVEPPPSGVATIAIAYDPNESMSRQDADAIAAYFGNGLKAGAAILVPRVIGVEQLSAGGFFAVVLASGVKPDQVSTATRSQHVPCITSDAAAVKAGQCVMSVKSTPRVEILVSRSAATRSSIHFGSAFLLMVHEI